MKREKLEIYYRIKTDCWRLMKKYQNPVDDDLYWESLIREGQQIYERYRMDFTKKEVMNVIDELDRIRKTGG